MVKLWQYLSSFNCLYSLFSFADGQVDAVTFATGTGGTVAGVAMYLKSKKPQVKAVVADPDVSSK